VHLDIIKVNFSQTAAQAIVLKNNIKIYIKTAPTCFGAVIPPSWSILSVIHYRPTNICSHITTNSIVHRCTITDYFKKV